MSWWRFCAQRIDTTRVNDAIFGVSHAILKARYTTQRCAEACCCVPDAGLCNGRRHHSGNRACGVDVHLRFTQGSSDTGPERAGHLGQDPALEIRYFGFISNLKNVRPRGVVAARVNNQKSILIAAE